MTGNEPARETPDDDLEVRVSDDDVVRLDAAERILQTLEGHALNEIDNENAKQAPNQHAIDYWSSLADRCRAETHKLATPADANRVLSEYGLLLKEATRQ